MITAGSSGGCGDIVYAIPVMKALGVERMYIKECWYKYPHHSLYSVMKWLVEMQGIEARPTQGGYPSMVYEPGLDITYDMDRFRRMPKRGYRHIIFNMMATYNVHIKNWKKPWLSISGDYGIKLPREYNLIHLTDRWRKNSSVNWNLIYSLIPKPVYFIGFREEHERFVRDCGDINYLPTGDILDMAILIRDCSALYCNQSVALTLAQGLGKEYFLEKNPGKTNTILYTPNEHIL